MPVLDLVSAFVQSWAVAALGAVLGVAFARPSPFAFAPIARAFLAAWLAAFLAGIFGGGLLLLIGIRGDALADASTFTLPLVVAAAAAWYALRRAPTS